MAYDGTATALTGQPGGTAAATTQTGTGDGQGQPAATAKTTTTSGTGAASGEEDTFFDPKDLPPELMPAYKGMQKAFSKKMEAVSQNRQKVESYDRFMKDPLTEIQAMASRMGYKLTRADAAAIAENATGGNGKDWEPQTWGEVMQRAKEEVLKELSPVFNELQSIKKSNLERMLDDSAPDWREHEEEMVALLKEHPTLAKDPVKLYRLALPPEILETRATQAALKKLQQKTDASKVGGTSTTKQAPPQMPSGSVSFNEAVEFAKRKLAEQGIRGPS